MTFPLIFAIELCEIAFGINYSPMNEGVHDVWITYELTQMSAILSSCIYP